MNDVPPPALACVLMITDPVFGSSTLILGIERAHDGVCPAQLTHGPLISLTAGIESIGPVSVDLLKHDPAPQYFDDDPESEDFCMGQSEDDRFAFSQVAVAFWAPPLANDPDAMDKDSCPEVLVESCTVDPFPKSEDDVSWNVMLDGWIDPSVIVADIKDCGPAASSVPASKSSLDV